MSKSLATAEPEAGSSEGALLAPLLRSDFFLTDGRGLVTRWGARPAHAFGRDAEDVVGRPAFEAVISGAEDWARHLAGDTQEGTRGEAPPPHVEATAAGEGFAVELLVLGVALSESLDVSRVLEAMAPDLTPQERLARMKRDLPDALEMVVARANGEPSEDTRLAGLVVAYTAPEREAPAPPPPPTAAVGEGEERLSRLGELEREVADLRETERNAVAVEELDRQVIAMGELEREVAALREQADAALALAEQALALVEHRAETAPAARPERERPDDAPPRPVREGLDDSTQAKAVIALDGRFEALNPAFEALVGYPESDFKRARWPSVVDRDRLADHRAILARLVIGEIEETRVETVYMHGQGLTVPVEGLLALVRSDEGDPHHLLLSVDD